MCHTFFEFLIKWNPKKFCKMQELMTFVKCKKLGKIISVCFNIFLTSLAIVIIWQIMQGYCLVR